MFTGTSLRTSNARTVRTYTCTAMEADARSQLGTYGSSWTVTGRRAVKSLPSDTARHIRISPFVHMYR